MGYYCKNLYKCLKENIYLYFSVTLFLEIQSTLKIWCCFDVGTL